MSTEPTIQTYKDILTDKPLSSNSYDFEFKLAHKKQSLSDKENIN